MSLALEGFTKHVFPGIRLPGGHWTLLAFPPLPTFALLPCTKQTPNAGGGQCTSVLVRSPRSNGPYERQMRKHASLLARTEVDAADQKSASRRHRGIEGGVPTPNPCSWLWLAWLEG